MRRGFQKYILAKWMLSRCQSIDVLVISERKRGVAEPEAAQGL
jgi:hypothetical protein